MINITLPNFYYYFEINKKLFMLKKQHPDFFYNKDINFIMQEGNFPFSYWAGRNTTNFKTALYHIFFKMINESRIPILFDCANPLLEKKDFTNRHQNIILELGQNGSNSVLVSSKNLLDYLKEKYPFYQFIGSEYYIADDPNLESLESLTRVKVLKSKLDTLQQKIPKAKIEVVLNEPCGDCNNKINCLCKEWENIYNFKETSEYLKCALNKKTMDIQWMDIEELYKLGYQYFCFDMKTFNLNNLEQIKHMYINLFIKPEYQKDALLLM